MLSWDGPSCAERMAQDSVGVGVHQSRWVAICHPVLVKARECCFIPGTIRAIGDQGLYVEARATLPVGTRVEVQFELPGENGAGASWIPGVVVQRCHGDMELRMDTAERGTASRLRALFGHYGNDRDRVV